MDEREEDMLELNIKYDEVPDLAAQQGLEDARDEALFCTWLGHNFFEFVRGVNGKGNDWMGQDVGDEMWGKFRQVYKLQEILDNTEIKASNVMSRSGGRLVPKSTAKNTIFALCSSWDSVSDENDIDLKYWLGHLLFEYVKRGDDNSRSVSEVEEFLNSKTGNFNYSVQDVCDSRYSSLQINEHGRVVIHCFIITSDINSVVEAGSPDQKAQTMHTSFSSAANDSNDASVFSMWLGHRFFEFVKIDVVSKKGGDWMGADFGPEIWWWFVKKSYKDFKDFLNHRPQIRMGTVISRSGGRFAIHPSRTSTYTLISSLDIVNDTDIDLTYWLGHLLYMYVKEGPGRSRSVADVVEFLERYHSNYIVQDVCANSFAFKDKFPETVDGAYIFPRSKKKREKHKKEYIFPIEPSINIITPASPTKEDYGDVVWAKSVEERTTYNNYDLKAKRSQGASTTSTAATTTTPAKFFASPVREGYGDCKSCGKQYKFHKDGSPSKYMRDHVCPRPHQGHDQDNTGLEQDVDHSAFLGQLSYEILSSPFYIDRFATEKYTAVTATISNKKELLSLFFQLANKVLPFLSADCYGDSSLKLLLHQDDVDIIKHFKEILSLSDSIVELVIDSSKQSHFALNSVYKTRLEMLQEMLVQYTRIYPCSSILQFFESSSDEFALVRVVSQSEEEAKSVTQMIESIYTRIGGSSVDDKDFLLRHFNSMVSYFDEKCSGGLITFTYAKPQQEGKSDFKRTNIVKKFPLQSHAGDSGAPTFLDPPSLKPFLGKEKFSTLSGFLQHGTDKFYAVTCGHDMFSDENGSLKINISNDELDYLEEQQPTVHRMWPSSMKNSDESNMFEAFYQPGLLLTVGVDKNYDSYHQSTASCVSDMSTISLSRNSVCKSQECKFLSFVKNSRPIFPQYLDYGNCVVSFTGARSGTQNINIIGQGHRSFRSDSKNRTLNFHYELFYLGSCQKTDGNGQIIELQGVENGDSGSPCLLKGKIHSFVTGDIPCTVGTGKFFTYLTPSHFGLAQCEKLLKSQQGVFVDVIKPSIFDYATNTIVSALTDCWFSKEN
eukprot:gene29559-38677_t